MTEKETKSIIPSKYVGKYKGASDWVGEFIEKHAYDAPEKGKGPAEMDLDRMLELLRVNHMRSAAVQYEAVRSSHNNGYFRMNIGNRLRAAARKRGGLYGLDDKWHKAGEGFECFDPLRETREGEKIVAIKEKKEDDQKAA